MARISHLVQSVFSLDGEVVVPAETSVVAFPRHEGIQRSYPRTPILSQLASQSLSENLLSASYFNFRLDV